MGGELAGWQEGHECMRELAVLGRETIPVIEKWPF